MGRMCAPHVVDIVHRRDVVDPESDMGLLHIFHERLLCKKCCQYLFTVDMKSGFFLGPPTSRPYVLAPCSSTCVGYIRWFGCYKKEDFPPILILRSLVDLRTS